MSSEIHSEFSRRPIGERGWLSMERKTNLLVSNHTWASFDKEQFQLLHGIIISSKFWPFSTPESSSDIAVNFLLQFQ